MANAHATTQAISWASTVNGAVVHAGVLDVGGSVYAPALISADSEPAFLAAVVAAAPDVSSFNPLPEVGEQVEGGVIYSHNGGLVMCRQTHILRADSLDVLALFLTHREDAPDVLAWIAGESVTVGALRTYGGETYRAVQTHVTQDDWKPGTAGVFLWELVQDTPGEWAIGVAYTVGDIVTYNGTTYRCLQSHTSQAGWTPPVVPALWAVVA